MKIKELVRDWLMEPATPEFTTLDLQYQVPQETKLAVRGGFYSGLANPEGWLLETLGGLPTDSGVPMSERSAVGLSAVWTCVNIRAGMVASLPLKVYERLPSGGRRVAREVREYRLLHDRPSSEDTSYTFRHKLVGNLLLWGNAYAQIETDGRGMVKALWPYHPQQVHIEYGNSRGDYWYVVTGQIGDAFVDQKVMPEDMLHLRGFCHEGLKGLSVIQNYRRGLGLAAATEIFAAHFYKHGARASGVLQYPGKLKQVGLDNLQKSFDEKYASTANSGKTIILEEGATYQQLTVPQNDAQFIETRQMSRAEIAGLFKIPTMMLPGSESHPATYASSEVFNRQLVDFTLRDDLTQWQNELNSKLFANGDFYCEFDLRDLLRGDMAARAAYWKARWEIGSISADEVRDDENENPLPDGDGKKFFVPLNYRDVSEPVPAPNTAPSEPNVVPFKKPPVAVGRGYNRLFANLVGEIKGWKTFNEKRATAKFRGSLLEPLALELDAEPSAELLNSCAEELAARSIALQEDQFDAELQRLIAKIREGETA